MPVCSFCKRRYNEPRGVTVFTFDGKSIHYCSSKCRRNLENLGRDPKKVKWVRRMGTKESNSTETSEPKASEPSEKQGKNSK